MRSLVMLAVAVGLGACKPKPPKNSEELLIRLHEALRKEDRDAWNALSVTARDDFDALCAGSDDPGVEDRATLRAAHEAAFDECSAMGPWSKSKRGFRELEHHGLNRDDRVCGEGEHADCPGLVRLCKSEVFAYDPDGEADLKINVYGAHRLPDDGLVLVRPPSCFRKDLVD